MDQNEVKINDGSPESKDKIKNDSTNIHNKDRETEPGEGDGEEHEEQEEHVNVKKVHFDYLEINDTNTKSFSFKNIQSDDTVNNIYENVGEYKYAICILLKDNSFNNCVLLEKTIKGIISNYGDLATISFHPEDIYIFVFINQIENKEYLVNNNAFQNITKDNKYLKVSVKPKDEEREIKIDVICKIGDLTEVESLQIFYNYILFKLKNEDKPIITSVMSAGVVPNKDCLKNLINICIPVNVRNQSKDGNKFGVAVPSLEIKELGDSNIFLKIAQYERAHFYIYDMSFYSATAAAPVTSLLNTMVINNLLLGTLSSYYREIRNNASIDYHDYNLALHLYSKNIKVNYYCGEYLGSIYYANFDYMQYKDNWINRFSGYYGNFFKILSTFIVFNGFLEKIFMFFQIIGLLIDFIYPSLSTLVIYSVFYECFRIYDIHPAVFITLLFLIIYFGSGACSLISSKSQKIEFVNYFFYIFMEVYYLFILICSIVAMDNMNKNRPFKYSNSKSKNVSENASKNENDFLAQLTASIEAEIANLLGLNDDPLTYGYKFNKAACGCLIAFTFVIAILPILFKISMLSKNIVQMLLYLVLGAPNSTSNFLIAKIWIAPETSGGFSSEDRKGLTIIFFFLFNLFFGYLNFYNYTRKKRAVCVMGLAIFHLIYLFFKVIAISFPLLCGTRINDIKDDKIIKALSSENINDLYKSQNALANSTDKFKSAEKANDDNTNAQENEEEEKKDDNGDENNEEEEKKDDNGDENNEEEEHNEEEERNDEDNVNQ